MAKCNITECGNKAIKGFEKADINKSVICWCNDHETDLADKVIGPGRWLNQEQVDRL
jgi:hypothetical protein